MSAADWRVTTDATDDDAYAILTQDRVWNSFALADLDPPLREYSQFAVAARGGTDERALCLVLRHPIIGQVLSPFGSVAGVAAILEQLDLPDQPLIQAQQAHMPLIERYYQPMAAWRGMLRMAVSAGEGISPPGPLSLRGEGEPEARQASPLQVRGAAAAAAAAAAARQASPLQVRGEGKFADRVGAHGVRPLGGESEVDVRRLGESGQIAPRWLAKPLTAADLPALTSLYASHPESAFSAALFAQGRFVGVYDGERLVAAGGTHALVPRHGIAVLGNIYTAPEARGQGLATAVTAALVASLFEQGYSPVVLNVFDDNAPAIRLYQRLGFRTQHQLVTGKARLSR